MRTQTPTIPIKPGDAVPWCRLPVGHRFHFLGVGESCLKTGDRTYQNGVGCIKTFSFSQTMNVSNLTEA